MSATEQMRAMLDELMGTSREGPDSNRHRHHFSDARVCKSFLLSCCPHDILASTRMDLGECPKVHDLALRADYEKASSSKNYGYELDALDHLQAFVADADRKTELAKKRLAETQEELSSEVTSKLNRVHQLAEQIGKKLAAAEQLGEEGNVEKSLENMEEVEKLKKEKQAAEMDYRNSMPASSYQQQKLRVCEVCSAYLGIHDNDRRLADHFGGKLHLGFITIRERLDDLKKLVSEKRSKGLLPDRNEENDRRNRHRDRGDRGPRYHYDRGRDRNLNERTDRFPDRGRPKDSEENFVKSNRSRSRSRERYYRRSRSRSPKRHSHRSGSPRERRSERRNVRE
ncbi:putative RNA-binding protein Luc7-like 2 [Brevipalpus obovatus]|uniref:putative RNA-binding protein Luc7-like 2 n=1 Tax=Brevipalpus obovatus TaxID=246614 RepID=UPI003D9F35AF